MDNRQTPNPRRQAELRAKRAVEDPLTESIVWDEEIEWLPGHPYLDMRPELNVAAIAKLKALFEASDARREEV